MEIKLTAAQTASWNDAQWRAGFLSALMVTLDNTYWCTILADDGATLGRYRREWKAV